MTGDVDELLSLATRLALEAGALLTDRRPDELSVSTKSTPTDVVTAMDKRIERLIVDGIHEDRPDDGILAEEGSNAAADSGVRWIIDPIDGTVNYLYGIPQYAVSIAAEVGGEITVGVVLDPGKGNLYTAVRGEGATCDGEPLRCSSQAELSQALVATGFGYAADRRAKQAQVLLDLLPRVRDIRRFGAAALDLCAVASGQVDAYYERGGQPWDVAAGGLVAQEAGAVVAGLHGAAAGEALTLAANPALFPVLHDLLAGLGADSD